MAELLLDPKVCVLQIPGRKSTTVERAKAITRALKDDSIRALYIRFTAAMEPDRLASYFPRSVTKLVASRTNYFLYKVTPKEAKDDTETGGVSGEVDGSDSDPEAS